MTPSPLSRATWASKRPTAAPPGRLDSGALLTQLLVEPLGLGFWSHAELTLENIATGLILVERGAAAALPGIEPHQRAMRALLQRLEGENSERQVGPPLARAF